MSHDADDVNKPLPRKSREESLAWAKQYTSAMAHYAGVKAADDPAPREDFENCVGKGDEVADDGRYTLTYTVYAKLPQEQHIPAVRKLREALEGSGVRVTSFDEMPAKDPEKNAVIMYARNDKERTFLVADTVKPAGTLRLEVSTPCFLPPGAEQQQF